MEMKHQKHNRLCIYVENKIDHEDILQRMITTETVQAYLTLLNMYPERDSCNLQG